MFAYKALADTPNAKRGWKKAMHWAPKGSPVYRCFHLGGIAVDKSLSPGYVRQGGSALAEIIACNTSFVERGGRKLLTAPILRSEIIRGEPLEVVSSDSEAVTVEREAWGTAAKSDPQRLS